MSSHTSTNKDFKNTIYRIVNPLEYRLVNTRNTYWLGTYKGQTFRPRWPDLVQKSLIAQNNRLFKLHRLWPVPRKTRSGKLLKSTWKFCNIPIETFYKDFFVARQTKCSLEHDRPMVKRATSESLNSSGADIRRVGVPCVGVLFFS